MILEMIIIVSKFVTIVSTPLLCVECELRQLTLLCHHHWRMWWWTLCGDRWHYCANTTVVCGLWMETVDTIVSTSLTFVVVDTVWRQMPLLCQHHWRVWTANGSSWHYCVITTDVCGGGLFVATDATMVSTPLLCVDCELSQLTLLCQHNWRVWWWTLCGDRCHYGVNTTIVSGLWMEAVDTIVSSPLTCVVVDSVAADVTIVLTRLLYMNCNWHQFTLSFFVGFVLLDLLFFV